MLCCNAKCHMVQRLQLYTVPEYQCKNCHPLPVLYLLFKAVRKVPQSEEGVGDVIWFNKHYV